MTQVARVMEDCLSAGSVEEAGEARQAAPVGEQAIERIEQALASRIGRDRFEMWFDGKARWSVQGRAVGLAVHNAFAANWIRTKFLFELRAAAADVLQVPSDALSVAISVDGTLSPAASVDEAATVAAPVKAAAKFEQGKALLAAMNPRHTLEEFVVGPSNQLAYHAALRVAENPGQQFNPLFIHGHCGMGKTHLLQGICQRFARQHPGKKWLYLTGETFTNEFLEAIRHHKMEAFRRRVRGAELLVIDDVHFLANKKATQEEFLHTFNQLDALGGSRQIVLASDCAPRAIAQMAESLVSRFVSGMVVRIDSPDLPTRLEILRRKAARNRWQVSDAVLMHVAQSAAGSVRELEGNLLQVVAGMTLLSSQPDAGSVVSVVSTLKDRTAMRSPVAVERIIVAAAAHFGVAEASVLGSTREKTVAMARAVAMYLARQHTGMSFPEIGRAMGGKNHSTVIAACQRVEVLIASGELVCWSMKLEESGPATARHQAMADVIHEIEGSLKRR